jgi:hypothetical protein
MKDGLGVVEGFSPMVNLIGLGKKRPVRADPTSAPRHLELDKSDNIEGGRKQIYAISNQVFPFGV